MMSNPWLQVGRSYGFSQAVEDRRLRDFERSQVVEGKYLVEETTEPAVVRAGFVQRLTLWLTSLAHASTALEVRRRHA